MDAQNHAFFLQAASCGDLSALNRYMQLMSDGEKWEAFSLAVENGHLNLVSMFLQKLHPDFTARRIFESSMPPDSTLHLAVKEGHFDVVREIVESVRQDLFRLQFRTNEFQSQRWDGIIALAVLHNHSQIVLYLIQNPLLKDVGPDRLHLLALAAHKGHSDTLKALIGISSIDQLRQRTNDGLTLLHLAAQSGCATEVMQLLLDGSTLDFNVRSSPDLFTPLHMAANSGQDDVVGFLLRGSGVDPMAKDCLGRTPLHYAAREGHVQVVQQFLQNNPQPNAVDFTDSDGLTPLHMAARGGHVQVIENLLKSQHCFNIMRASKHSVNLRRFFNISFGSHRFFGFPLSAIRFPRPKLIDSLFWRTAGYTPLHFAARYGHHEAVKILLKEIARIRNDHAQNSARSHELEVMQNQENMFQKIYLILEKAVVGADVPEIIMQIGCMNSSNVNIAMREVSEERQALEMLQFPWEDPLPITLLSQSQADLLTSEEVNATEYIMDEKKYMTLNEEWAMQSNERQLCLNWAASRGDVRWMKRLLAHKNIDINEDGANRTARGIALQHANVEATTELFLHPNMKLDDFTVDGNMKTLMRSIERIFSSDIEISERRQKHWENLLLALLMYQNVGENAALLKPLLSLARKIGLAKVERAIVDRPELKKSLFEDRKMYLDCANAILVGAALIAAVAYQGWLQPPLGYTFKDELEDTLYADVETHEAVRYFWWFNSFAFFFSITSLIAGAIGAMPVVDRMDILKSAEKAKKAVAVASVLLGMAVMCVVVAFSLAGFGVVPPMSHILQIMRVSVGCGTTICGIVFLWFWKRLRPLFLEVFPFLWLFLEPIDESHLQDFVNSRRNLLPREEEKTTKRRFPYCRAYYLVIVGYLLRSLRAIGFRFLDDTLYHLERRLYYLLKSIKGH